MTYFASKPDTRALWRVLHSIFMLFAVNLIPIRDSIIVRKVKLLIIMNVKLPIIIQLYVYFI